jgi:hypothetical protein
MARTWFVEPDGTLWPTNGEHPLPQEETFQRWDRKDKTALHPEEKQQKVYLRKLESKFVAQCAAAFVQRTLSETNPRPPAEFRNQIGGDNIAWLNANPIRLEWFKKSACGQGWTGEQGGRQNTEGGS